MRFSPFISHLAIIVAWPFLTGGYSALNIFGGYVVGLLVMLTFPEPLNAKDYTRRTFAFFLYFLVFAKNFILASLSVAFIILFKARRALTPRLVHYHTKHLSRTEILILAHSITLTPGTTAVHLSEDLKTMTVHALDGKPAEKVRKSIHDTLEVSILRFTR